MVTVLCFRFARKIIITINIKLLLIAIPKPISMELLVFSLSLLLSFFSLPGGGSSIIGLKNVRKTSVLTSKVGLISPFVV